MDELSKPTKKAFPDLCILHNFHYSAQKALAKAAGVDKGVVGAMFLGSAVRRHEAEKVLEAFGDATDETYTLDNVRVALMPTFVDLHEKHPFDLASLAKEAGVAYAVVDMMLNGIKVTPQDAHLVLQMMSALSGELYTLETVDVPVIQEEESHE